MLAHLHSSVDSWQTLVSISLQVSMLNVAECKAKTLEHSAAQPCTVPGGHYFSSLPKNIIVKAIEEI